VIRFSGGKKAPEKRKDDLMNIAPVPFSAPSRRLAVPEAILDCFIGLCVFQFVMRWIVGDPGVTDLSIDAGDYDDSA